jgi:hypothetical protein
LERKVARENKELQDAAAEYHHKENFVTAEYCDKQGYTFDTVDCKRKLHQERFSCDGR